MYLPFQALWRGTSASMVQIHHITACVIYSVQQQSETPGGQAPAVASSMERYISINGPNSIYYGLCYLQCPAGVRDSRESETPGSQAPAGASCMDRCSSTNGPNLI